MLDRTIHRSINSVCALFAPYIPHIHSIQQQLATYVALLLEHGSRFNLIGTVEIEALCDQFIDVLSGWSTIARVVADIERQTHPLHLPPTSTGLSHDVPHNHKQPRNRHQPHLQHQQQPRPHQPQPLHHQPQSLHHQPQPLTIADIGSGNGLPGIPCAMLLPQHQFVLIDTKPRRIEFLATCINRLALTNVTVVHSAYQELPTRYDVIIVRALTLFTNKVCRKLKKLLYPHGGLVAYKGNDQQFLAEHTALTRCFEQVVVHSVLPTNNHSGKHGRIIITATASHPINNPTSLETMPSA